MDEIYEIVKQTVMCTTWLARRGEITLAHDMRNEFMREWEVPDEMWNDAVTDLMDWVSRKGTTPEVSLRQLEMIAL
jgi:hypothetical protein